MAMSARDGRRTLPPEPGPAPPEAARIILVSEEALPADLVEQLRKRQALVLVASRGQNTESGAAPGPRGVPVSDPQAGGTESGRSARAAESAEARQAAETRESAETRKFAETGPVADAAVRADPERIVFHSLDIDLGCRRVCWAGRPIDLSGHEIGLLALLAARPGRAYSFKELFAQVWGAGYRVDPPVVHSAIRRLRRKLDDDSVGIQIESVRGYGFRISLSPPEPPFQPTALAARPPDPGRSAPVGDEAEAVQGRHAGISASTPPATYRGISSRTRFLRHRSGDGDRR
jgi:DNA-binding winged helix-turn-helix (wHTH) protein